MVHGHEYMRQLYQTVSCIWSNVMDGIFNWPWITWITIIHSIFNVMISELSIPWSMDMSQLCQTVSCILSNVMDGIFNWLWTMNNMHETVLLINWMCSNPSLHAYIRLFSIPNLIMFLIRSYGELSRISVRCKINKCFEASESEFLLE